MRAYVEKNVSEWHRYIKYATFVYNNSVHSTTGYSPHELAHGFKIQIPNSIIKSKSPYNYDDFADEVRGKIKEAHKLAEKRLQKRKETNKRNYDKDKSDLDIEIGDLVLTKNHNKKTKFDNQYDGPYRVIDASEAYVTIMKNKKPVKVHKNDIKTSRAKHDNIPPEAFQIITPNDQEFAELFE